MHNKLGAEHYDSRLRGNDGAKNEMCPHTIGEIGTGVALPLTFYYFGFNALSHCPSLERAAITKKQQCHCRERIFWKSSPRPLRRGTHGADSERTIANVTHIDFFPKKLQLPLTFLRQHAVLYAPTRTVVLLIR